MNKEDKAWILAVAYSTTRPQDITPEEFLAEVERSEVDFLLLLSKQEQEKTNESFNIWEKLGSAE